tara:strand:- start:420 stop:851 length:432 start_codon:yes stop_codon:yes gene_type:complete
MDIIKPDEHIKPFMFNLKVPSGVDPSNIKYPFGFLYNYGVGDKIGDGKIFLLYAKVEFLSMELKVGQIFEGNCDLVNKEEIKNHLNNDPFNFIFNGHYQGKINSSENNSDFIEIDLICEVSTFSYVGGTVTLNNEIKYPITYI